jgi:hypothetical protein
VIRHGIVGGAVSICFALTALDFAPNYAGDIPNNSSVTTDPMHNVRVLNIDAHSVNVGALKMAVNQIADLLQQDKLIRTRVKIFADHPIVQEAMANKTIEATISTSPPVILLIPLSYRGNRVIVKRRHGADETYSLYSLPDDARVDLNACLKG